MDIIHQLPDSVANQIAAGEVIQRPASCLKELVENAIDADATRIQVLLRDAGRTLVQVIDNGKGMSKTDARMAFERHATSKIHVANDLFQLHTMGFRGEALASICAVAQVEVLTRCSDAEMGTRLEIQGSVITCEEPCACPVGTNIKVKNLFFNVPVRRKFLKSDQTELRNIITDFYRIVLTYPKIQFTLVHQDEILLELTAGTEKQRIEAIFQRSQRQSFTSQLLDIHCDTDLVSIRGFVGKPETAGKNAQQYFFVNGRFMRHPYFHKAVMTAYQGMLQGEDTPSYFIYFDINPENIDVNIHPTKTEIKFSDEQPIFQILLATVREALGKFNVAPSLNFEAEGQITIPVTERTSHPELLEHPVTTRNTSYNPFKAHAISTPAKEWQPLYESSSQIAQSLPMQPETEHTLPFDINEGISKCYQYAGRYILFSTHSGLMVVDQHRAHACILYRTYYHQMENVQIASQQLLFPEVWEVNTEDVPLVEQLRKDLHLVGFELEQLDKNAYSIIGIPPRLDTSSIISTLQQIVEDTREVDMSIPDHFRRKIALRLAYETAIPYGKVLTEEEMAHLIGELTQLEQYQVTEDGKTIVTVFLNDEIAKRF